MRQDVKERVIARITVGGQPKTIELTVCQPYPDAVLYTNDEHKVFYFQGRGLHAALGTFRIFIMAMKKDANPLATIGAIRAAEILDTLNNYEEILEESIVG